MIFNFYQAAWIVSCSVRSWMVMLVMVVVVGEIMKNESLARDCCSRVGFFYDKLKNRTTGSEAIFIDVYSY